MCCINYEHQGKLPQELAAKPKKTLLGAISIIIAYSNIIFQALLNRKSMNPDRFTRGNHVDIITQPSLQASRMNKKKHDLNRG